MLDDNVVVWIKDNNKIEGYKLKFLNGKKTLFFSFLYDYHDWKKIILTILSLAN